VSHAVLARIEPSKCVAIGAGLTAAYLNRTAAFTVQARDQFDEPITEGGQQVNVEISIGDEEIPCQVDGALL